MAAASEATATEPVADADASQPPSSVLEINPDTYDDQLQSKVAKIKEQFSNFKCPEIEVHTSPPMHYRQRTELSVWHDQGDMYYVMYKPVPGQQRPQRTRVETFPVASKLINKLMVAVREYVIKHTVLRERLFQVRRCAGCADCAGVAEGACMLAAASPVQLALPLQHQPCRHAQCSGSCALPPDGTAHGSQLHPPTPT